MRTQLCMLAATALAAVANAQDLQEDFESGIPADWTTLITIPSFTNWQSLPNGQCGAITGMAGFTGSACVTGARSFPSFASLTTPLFTLTGAGPHEVRLDSILDMNLSVDSISVVVTSTTAFAPVTIGTGAEFQNNGLLETVSLMIPAFLAGDTIDVSFNGEVTSQGGGTLGWLIDNVVVGEAGDGNQYCFGDGSGTACPCGNNSAPGDDQGCLNSSGIGATLTASGGPQVSNDTLSFALAGGTPNSFGLLASADNQLPAANPGAGLQAFDGLRCIGGNLIRHGTRALDAGGANASPWGFGGGPAGGLIAQGGFGAGQTRQWQVFYRDDDLLVCQTGQNQSSAVEITFVP